MFAMANKHSNKTRKSNVFLGLMFAQSIANANESSQKELINN